jgi:LysR family transcriptional regulator for metE and metH
MVVVSGAGDQAGIECKPLFEDELRFIMPPGHRLATREYIEAEDIAGEDFITYTRVPEPDREYALLFRPSNAFPNWVETVEVPEAIVEMVAAGLGISVLAGWAIRGALDSGRIVSARAGSQGIRVPWQVATRIGAGEDEETNREVAAHLARWCQQNGGLMGVCQ